MSALGGDTLKGRRAAIIGAGHVGATTAYAMMLRALFREIVLIDSDAALAAAEATDLTDANALARPARIWAGTYADAASAQIAILTAGAATHGSETRLAMGSRSAVIIADCVGSLMDAGFAGIIIVAANPVDVMAMVAWRRSGLPARQVIGTGTLLDTSRLRQELAGQLDVAPAFVEALVLGEHGDSEVVAFSALRIGGLSLDRFTSPADEPDHDAIARKVRDAAYAIIAGKGYTSFGIATAIVRICEAIVRDERAVLPVSTMMTGQFGIENVYLSLPCILGANGVLKVLTPMLEEDERQALQASAKVVKAAMTGLEKELGVDIGEPAENKASGGLPEPATTFPDDLGAYKRTPEFTEQTVPAGLLKAHSTKDGVWGRICVTSGKLAYRVVDPRRQNRQVVLVPGVEGVVEPTILHEVEPNGAVSFFVEFLR